MRTYTQEQVIAKLRAKQGHMSATRFAEDELDVSQPYLSDVYAGNRTPGRKILKYLGLAKEKTVSVVYFENR